MLCSACTRQGKDTIPFLEGLVVGDVAGIPDGSGSLSVFTNEKGGIIDDTGGWVAGWQGGQVADRSSRVMGPAGEIAFTNEGGDRRRHV